MRWGNLLIVACCALFVAVIAQPTGFYDGAWKLASGANAADWAQFFGTMIAIGAGFALVPYQEGRRKRAVAFAAASLARDALQQVTDRFENVIGPKDRKKFALRGLTATEMVEVMRQLTISELPPKLIALFASIRSDTYAVNRRIDDVLKGPASDRMNGVRERRLRSAARVYSQAHASFDRMRAATSKNGVHIEPVAIPAQLATLIVEGWKEADGLVEAPTEDEAAFV